MVDEIDRVQGADSERIRLQSLEAKQASSLVAIEQVASEEALEELADYGSDFNPLFIGRNFREIDKRAQPNLSEIAQEQSEDSTETASTQKAAEHLQKRSPELSTKSLLLIKSTIHPDDPKETILGKIRNSYPDASLADDILDFLIETTSESNPLKETLRQTKKEFNEVNGREIRAGKNISQEVHEFSKAGLGSPTALRDLYREIIGNPREPVVLFEELSQKFSFPDMKKVIDFVLHSIGADLKSKGPSIDPLELQRLFSEVRTMQSILGVYRFFNSRMNLIKGEFSRAGLALPSSLNFMVLSKVFVKLLQDRYPSVERVLQLSTSLGILGEIIAKIILFTQYRDALRHVSPRLFKSEKHRQDLLLTLLEALTELEDEMEEDEDEDEDEE